MTSEKSLIVNLFRFRSILLHLSPEPIQASCESGWAMS
jgi:hypothetical protein